MIGKGEVLSEEGEKPMMLVKIVVRVLKKMKSAKSIELNGIIVPFLKKGLELKFNACLNIREVLEDWKISWI